MGSPHHPSAHDDHPYDGSDRRSLTTRTDEIEPVRLTRKLAEAIDGISLEGREVGDRMPLPSNEARMLLAEGWAEPLPPELRRSRSGRS